MSDAAARWVLLVDESVQPPGLPGVVPLLLSPSITIDALLDRIAAIGRALKGCTEELVFSFADIAGYRKVMRNLAGTECREFTHDEKVEFGMYNTCPHLCRYCYANANDESVLANWKRHGASLCGEADGRRDSRQVTARESTAQDVV